MKKRRTCRPSGAETTGREAAEPHLRRLGRREVLVLSVRDVLDEEAIHFNSRDSPGVLQHVHE